MIYRILPLLALFFSLSSINALAEVITDQISGWSKEYLCSDSVRHVNPYPGNPSSYPDILGGSPGPIDGDGWDKVFRAEKKAFDKKCADKSENDARKIIEDSYGVCRDSCNANFKKKIGFTDSPGLSADNCRKWCNSEQVRVKLHMDGASSMADFLDKSPSHICGKALAELQTKLQALQPGAEVSSNSLKQVQDLLQAIQKDLSAAPPAR